MSTNAKSYVAAMIAAGVFVLGAALLSWPAIDPVLFSVYLGLTILASAIKMRLPGITGTYSLSFVSILVGVRFFSLPEILVAACAGALVQTVWRSAKRPSTVQVAFNMANLTLSAGLCYLVWREGLAQEMHLYGPALLCAVTVVLFVTNTLIVSGILSILEGQPLAAVWREWYPWSFPYYLTGACIVGLLPDRNQAFRPESLWLLIPLFYLLHFYVGLAHSQRPDSGAQPAAGRGPLAPARVLPPLAKRYVQSIAAVGGLLLLLAILRWESSDLPRFAAYLSLGLVASTLKIRLPGLASSMSILFVFTLVAIFDCSLPEIVVLSIVTGMAQCMWKPKRKIGLLQAFFNGSCHALSASFALLSFRFLQAHTTLLSVPVSLTVATVVLYTCNAALVAVVLCLIDHRPLRRLWSDSYFWSFPYYLVGTAAAGLMITVSHTANWHVSLLVLPIMVLIYLSYQLQVSRSGGRPLGPRDHAGA